MILNKLKFIYNKSLKNYFFYALGEIFLIVAGILIAMKVDNYNSTKKYEKVMDNNFIKVAHELKNNIDNAKISIDLLQNTDSIIRLIMSDTIKSTEYYKNKDYASISMQYMFSTIGIYDYENLINFNVSDNQYHSELISELRLPYGRRDFIIENENIIKKFVKEKSIPFFAANVKSFDEYLYTERINDDMINFISDSKDYKMLLSQYAQNNYILLLSYQMFYEDGLKVYNKLAQVYHFEPITTSTHPNIETKIKGKYVSQNLQDTANLIIENDTLYVLNRKNKKKLIRLNDYQYYYKLNDGMYPFMTFNPDSTFNVQIKFIDMLFTKIHE